MITLNTIIIYILVLIMSAAFVYVILLDVISCAAISITFYLFKRRTTKYLHVAKKGGFCSMEQLHNWFDVEHKIWLRRLDKIDKIHTIMEFWKEGENEKNYLLAVL